MLWRSLCCDDAELCCLLYAFRDGLILCIVYDTTLVDVLFVTFGRSVNRLVKFYTSAVSL